MFCSFIWPCFFVSWFLVFIWVYFYVLSIDSMSPGLGRMGLCSRCSVGASTPHLPITWVQSSRCISPYRLCAHSCFSWVLIPVGTSMGMIYPKPLVWGLAEPLWGTCCAAASLMVLDSLQWGLVPDESAPYVCHLWMSSGGAFMWSEFVPQICWLWSLLGDTSKGQRRLVFFPGPPAWATKWSADGCYLCWV